MSQVTTGMVGAGFYDANSEPQLMSIKAVLPILQEAIGKATLPAAPEPIRIADFGCSEGANSTEALRAIVAEVRRHSSRPIQTVQSDLPTNDYTALLRRLEPETMRKTYGPDVYGAVVPGSMYEQLLPPGVLTVATTFNAIGFLGRRPLDRLPGFVLPNGPKPGFGGAVDPADRAACKAQAAEDLAHFLTARAAELVPGGLLLIEVFGEHAGRSTAHSIYDVLHEAWTDAFEAGLVDQATYERFYQPVWFRTVDELVAPVRGADATHADRFACIEAQALEVPYPFWETYRQDGDGPAFARAFVDFFRAFTAPVIEGVLPAAGRGPVVDAVYERAFERVAADPARYEPHYVSVFALLRRL